MQKEKLIIIFTVLVDVIGFGIVIPILPFYVGSFGASAFTITLLFACFSFFAFISSPFLGALSDKIGRRPVLIVSILSTAVGWFVFASAHTIAVLFLGRIIDGVAAGNFTIAQSYLVDMSRDEKERTTNLGIIGATFGIGFMLGPLIGGLLSKVSHAFPFWFAGMLASANTLTAYFFLPETHHHRNTEAALNYNPLLPLLRAALDKKLRPNYLNWFLFALGFITSQTVFALYVKAAFGFDSFTTGLLFTAAGVFSALNQGLLLKRVWLKYFSQIKLELSMFALFGLGLVLMGSTSLWLFYLAIPLIATGQSVLRVVITSEVAGHAEPHMKGEMIGILSAVMAASMVVGPIFAGALFELHHSTPFFAAAAFMAIGFTITLRRHRKTIATSVTA